MTAREHIPQEDLSLFAMQALSPEESAAVRAHVDACAECRAELAAAMNDLALVALSAEPHSVPEGARQRFLDRMAADASDSGRTAKVVSIDAEHPASRVYSSIQWSAVAAMLVIAFALTVKIGSLRLELKQESAKLAAQSAESARAQRVLQVLTARGAQHVLLTAANTHPAPSARAVYLASSGGLIFQANDLAPLPAGKTYELWVIPADGKAPIPAGLFQPDAAGSASVILPPLPSGVPAKAFGVTMERAEGAATPTAPILLVGAAQGE
jgi:hypothetical protein